MRTHLAPLPQKDGKYVALESTPDTWDNRDSRHDHPSFLMALGMLPGDGVDRAAMQRTLDATLATWDWETKIWGWDYPMIAMTVGSFDHQRGGDFPGDRGVVVDTTRPGAPGFAFSVDYPTVWLSDSGDVEFDERRYPAEEMLQWLELLAAEIRKHQEKAR